MIADLLAASAVGDVTDEFRIRLGSRRVRVRATANEHEIDRRQQVRLGAVTNPTLLNALAEMPAYEAMTWAALDRRVQRILRQAPPGTIDRGGGSVTRRLAPPVRVEQITVWARSGRAGLEAASKFAPYARRVVELPRAAITDVIRLDAALYGIGVHVCDGNTVHEVVTAAPFVVQKWTWASWLFAEQVFAQLSDAAVA